MAKQSNTIKGKYRTATLRKGKGKLAKRTCVRVEADKAGKSAVKGVTLAKVQFHGCFTSAAEARSRAKALADKKYVGPKAKRSKKRSKK